MVEWLAGNRIRGTSTERTSTSGFNPVTTVTGGWKEVGRTTLGSAGDTIDVSSLPDKRYYMLLIDGVSSGVANTSLRFNGDSGNNYAKRRSHNGLSDSTAVNQTSTNTDGFTSRENFDVAYVSNLASKQKLIIRHTVDRGTAGAGNTADRVEIVSKWANTSDAIDQITVTNTLAGDLASDSELVVLGWDPDDTHTTNFWEELADVSWTSGSTFATPTFTAKKYLWIQMYKAGTASSSISCRLNFNDDTSSVYNRRLSANGAGDWTGSPPYDGIHLSPNNITSDYCNIFMVNNSANEKLIMVHIINKSTAGSGTAPNRMELVGKWVPSSNQQVTKVHMTSVNDALIAGSRIKVWGSN